MKTAEELDFRPFSVFIGIVFGTLSSIAFSLAVVAFMFLILRGSYPRLEAELAEVLRSAALFVVLATIAGVGFRGMLRRAPWRYPVLLVLLLGLIGTGFYYWPEPS